MPKEYLGQITEEANVGGETVVTIVGEVCRFQPKTRPQDPWKIRMSLVNSGQTYLWTGGEFDFDTVNLDPETETSWEAE